MHRVLFSDIVNSTEINAHVGDARWMELLHEHNEIVRREKAFHRGYEVKTIGDAFMLAFQSAPDAVHCARKPFSTSAIFISTTLPIFRL